jgi:hypothetical protein
MRDYSLARTRPDRPIGQSTERALSNFRLRELERRVGRIEAFLLGILCTIALSVLGGLAALLNLPAP